MGTNQIPAPGRADGKLVRIIRPSLVVLCGPAACGKSTFAERHFRPTQIISSDWARARVCDDDRDQRFNTQAFALVHFLIEQRLILNRLCVVDSTALTPMARKELLTLAKEYHVPTVAILLDVPLETCVERDKKRERSVGQAIIERQYEAFTQVKAAISQEGFDQVLEFRDCDLDKVRFEILFRPVTRSAPRPSRPEPGPGRRPERAVRRNETSAGGAGAAGFPARAGRTAQPAPPAAAPRPVTSPAPVSALPDGSPTAAPRAATTEPPAKSSPPGNSPAATGGSAVAAKPTPPSSPSAPSGVPAAPGPSNEK